MQLSSKHLLLLAFLFLSSSLGAEPTTRAVVKVNAYLDNDNNQILTPHTSVQSTVNPSLSLGAHVGVDVVSSASIDVISAATPVGSFIDIRTETGANMAYSFSDWTLNGAGRFSTEDDFRSVSGTLGISRDLAQKNTTAALSYSFTESDVGRVGDDTFNEDLDSHVVNASLTQVINQKTLAQIAVYAAVFVGFQSSPYRMVRFNNGAAAPEQVPDDRQRYAGVLRVKHALSSSSFLGADYRFYFDTWGLQSHMAEISFSQQPNKSFKWRLRNRIYRQSGADFYADTYAAPQKFMSSDREHSPFISDTLGGKIAVLAGDFWGFEDVWFDLKADLGWQHFSDFDRQPNRLMWVTEIGMNVGF